jgi:SH3 domain-containing YSC84-like protein 1
VGVQNPFVKEGQKGERFQLDGEPSSRFASAHRGALQQGKAWFCGARALTWVYGKWRKSPERGLMTVLTKFAGAATLACALIAAPAALASDQTEVLDHADRTVSHLKSDPAFKVAADMLGKAKAVLIVPRLVKGGFIFGAEGGDGVLLKRNGKSWSSPAFYSLASASFGLQIGLEQAELVFIIMTDRALKGIERSEFKLGAGAGITVVTLSSGAEGATTGQGGDIVVWASGTGAYGGLTFNGSVVKSRDEWNEDFYGHNATVPSILANRVHNRATADLQHNLATVW